MGSNFENDRSVTTSKMYPIDLAPQKITIVKSVTNPEVKMAHLISGQPKTTGTSQIITHTGPISLMRPAAQIISSGVPSQPQMIVSGSPIMQGTQIVSQGSQIISQPQLIGPSGQLLTQTTQIISQGSQGIAGNNTSIGNTQVSVTPVSGTQVLNVPGQLMSGSGNLVVSSSVRTLSQSVRVIPPLPHHNTRPVISSVSLGSGCANVVVNKGVSSHVPRGPVAGASLAVPRVAARPITPVSSPVSIPSLGASWSGGPRGGGRGTLVYSARAPAPRAPVARTPAPPPHSAIATLPNSTVLTSTGVITTSIRAVPPRVPVSSPAPSTIHAPPTQRPIPLLQRNYQPAKVVGVASVGVRTPVGNSAPSQLYYEVSRPPAPHSAPPAHAPQLPRVLAPYNHLTQPPTQVNIANALQLLSDNRIPTATVLSTTVLPRPSILRKREIDGSPTKAANVGQLGGCAVSLGGYEPPRVEDAMPAWAEEAQDGTVSREGSISGSGGGSTTMSAASSPEPEEPPSPPRAPSPPMSPSPPSPPSPPEPPRDVSPRKKPRKQMLSSGVRQCEFSTVVSPPPAPQPPPQKRPQLSSSYVCGWRATALHFTRPADVRRREPRARDIVALANQRHVVTTADGWKVHHLTAQMDDLVSLEADVSEQLSRMLRTLETAHGKAQAALSPHTHALLELVKGNIQRSKIVCEGIRESREDILRVFTHRTFVGDILTRQADKRSFRKHRSQS